MPTGFIGLEPTVRSGSVIAIAWVELALIGQGVIPRMSKERRGDLLMINLGIMLSAKTSHKGSSGLNGD